MRDEYYSAFEIVVQASVSLQNVIMSTLLVQLEPYQPVYRP